MPSGMVCSCGCSEIDTDPARGNAVCTSCGSVLEEQIIVSEVQFQENSAGGCNAIGQFVSQEGRPGMTMGGSFRHHGMGKESREITLQNGKNRIQKLGSQLKLNHHCIETAYNFFKMAVSRGLTRGKRTIHVTTACLYMVCRTEGTPHLLLDFSDVLQIDVYVLGRTYLQLSKDLCINIPALDPCLYIQRFAHNLEFGDKTHEVSMTALRLVSRMKRDWISQGRRPSGLCGAALLVAGRIHNFSRTIKDVIKVVKIGGSTIRKRLLEFEKTPSSKLTIDEFQKIDLEEEMDPPCYTEGKRRAKIHQLECDMGVYAEEIADLQKEIDEAIQESIQKKMRRFEKHKAAAVEAPGVSAVPLSVDDLDKELQQYTEFIDNQTLQELLGKSQKPDDDPESDEQRLVERLQAAELEKAMYNERNAHGARPTVASLGLTSSIEECLNRKSEAKTEEGVKGEESESGELDLTGIDDDEIDKLILGEDEVKIKTTIWMRANADYLREQIELTEKRAREEEEKKNKPETKKRRTSKKKAVKIEAASAGEAIEKMLQERKISSKINYDVLKDLNKPEEKAGPLLGVEPTRAEDTVDAMPVITGISNKRGRAQNPVQPSRKKARSEVKEEQTAAVSKVEEVIVESGPVDYARDDEGEEEREDGDEEREEEEDEHYSAAQLFGNTGEEMYGEEDYED